ncbi:anion permease [Pediococcus pentosaceus]|nr:anion permease [Pediococcus pentosaceus]MCM6793686.1 anion permease [Pediococcus pentosaceus]MCM6810989.1 anion permease [Pediococcus pentosaceus]MCM6812627.1 anion permease [Pediococcus pentosaceus]
MTLEPVSVLFGSGFIKQKDWWQMNAILGVVLVYIVIGVGIGSL